MLEKGEKWLNELESKAGLKNGVPYFSLIGSERKSLEEKKKKGNRKAAVNERF